MTKRKGSPMADRKIPSFTESCAGCALWDRTRSPAVCGNLRLTSFNRPTGAHDGCEDGLSLDAPIDSGTLDQQASHLRLTVRSLLRLADHHELREWLAEIPGHAAASVLDVNDLREMDVVLERIVTRMREVVYV